MTKYISFTVIRHTENGRGQIEKSHMCQYRVCPPLTASTVAHINLILLISVLTTCMGIRRHFSCNARSRSRTLMTSLRSLILRPRWSHMCSMGERSCDLDGQGRTAMLLRLRTSLVYLAVCGRALSCWKSRACRNKKGTTTGTTISSQYELLFVD